MLETVMTVVESYLSGLDITPLNMWCGIAGGGVVILHLHLKDEDEVNMNDIHDIFGKYGYRVCIDIIRSTEEEE